MVCLLKDVSAPPISLPGPSKRYSTISNDSGVAHLNREPNPSEYEKSAGKTVVCQLLKAIYPILGATALVGCTEVQINDAIEQTVEFLETAPKVAFAENEDSDGLAPSLTVAPNGARYVDGPYSEP